MTPCASSYQSSTPLACNHEGVLNSAVYAPGGVTGQCVFNDTQDPTADGTGHPTLFALLFILMSRATSGNSYTNST